MKKTVFVLLLILGIVHGVFCQTSGPMDLVVLLDTSASMSSSYRETSDYLIGPFLREFLRIGDTFHLISFAGNPRIEISRRIEGVGDVEAVIGRLLLMYPLDPQSDLAGALSYAENYSSSLPGNRFRRLILVSDGDAPGTQSLVDASSGRLKNRGGDLQYIKVPVIGTGPSSGRPPAQTASGSPAAAAAQTPAASPQTQTVTQPSGQTQGTPPASGQVQPVDQGTPLTGAQTGSQITPQDTVTPPAGTQDQKPTSDTQTPPPPAGGSQTVTPPPATGTQQQQPAQQQPSSGTSSASSPAFSGGIPLWLIIALIILALLILGLIIFFATRNLHNGPNRVMAQAAAPMDARDRLESQRQEQIRGAEMMDDYAKARASERKPMPKDKEEVEPLRESGDGPAMLNLFVEDQNTAIGRRNIHVVKPGYTFSVGGGKSDFLIFLVPIPPHIADVQISGNNCTFYPRSPEFFPDIGSQPVPACIGKTIRVISRKNYELHIRMERYEDPLKALNKMLHSIQVPGEVT